MKYALLLYLSVILADSTSSSVIRLAGEFGERITVDSVTTVTMHNGCFVVGRNKVKYGVYPTHLWTIDGIAKAVK